MILFAPGWSLVLALVELTLVVLPSREGVVVVSGLCPDSLTFVLAALGVPVGLNLPQGEKIHHLFLQLF